DERAVGPVQLLVGAHHHGFLDPALLDGGIRQGVLHRDDDDVPDARVLAARPTENLDALHELGAAVVRDVQERFHLYHGYFAFSTISTRRQRFSLLSGRDSTTRTVSPIPHSFFSSCALIFFVRVRYFLYSRCSLRWWISTTIVFCILLLTTRPWRTFLTGTVFRAFPAGAVPRAFSVFLLTSSTCRSPSAS